MDITGLGQIANLAKDIIDKIFPNKLSDAERAQSELALQKLLIDHEESTTAAKRDIIITEMQQQDPFTKRARPTIVYAGLFFIFLVNVLFPIMAFYGSASVPNLQLPSDFWWIWGGVCSVWMIGRSWEKVSGAPNAVTGGTKK